MAEPQIVTDVEFPAAHGTILRGDLYLPAARPGASDVVTPGIVMAHGFSATRGMGLQPYARAFQDAGYAVLAYDHRNFGNSDGEPRQQINPWSQARDYRHALSYLAARPDVDAQRLAIWGSSYSGGQVLVVGAIDKRVKVVIANVPFAGLSAERVPAADAAADAAAVPARVEEMRLVLEDTSGNGPADTGEVLGPMAVVDPDGGPAFLPQPESARWFLKEGAAVDARWINSFTLQSGFGSTPSFNPASCIPAIAPRALLMVVATHDQVASTEVAVAGFGSAGQPSRLELIEGGHFDDYEGPGFRQACAAMCDFLGEHL